MQRRYRFLFTLLITIGLCACHQPYYIQQRNSQVYEINDSSKVDANLLAMLAPYKLGVDTQMQVIIAHTDIPLTKAQPECLLGNFIADAQLVAAKKVDPKVVLSVSNYGGIRIPYIAPGTITRGKMYELMPFDNTLTIVEITGADIKKFCNHMAKAKGWPVSGLTFTIKDKEATDVLVNGAVPNDHVYYKIAVSDYVAKGGDNCDFLIPLRKRNTSIFIRDAMIEYAANLEAQGKPLHPQIENRVQYAE